MKFLKPGQGMGFANEMTMHNHLMQFAISEPEIIPQMATLYEAEASAFSSLLAKKGMTSKGLFAGYSDQNYRVVGNRKIMWPVKGIEARVGRIISYECDNTSYPGKGGEIVTLYIDTDWFSPYDVLELKDNRTLVTVASDVYPEETETGVWAYKVKLNRKSNDSYISTSLLEENSEIGFLYTNFYEASETGYEKYTFDDWATSHMTIQRMKWSVSGTASQEKSGKFWVGHNGEMTWMSHQEAKMLERWAKAREAQMIWGVGTVDANDEVYLKDLKGREIVSGDGLMNLGDGSLKFPYTDLSLLDIENVMSNLAIFGNNDGVMEVAVIAGQKYLSDFSKIMKKEVGAAKEVIVDGQGAQKGVNNTFAFYEWNGVRIVPVWHKYFDSPWRPKDHTTDGIRKSSMNAIFTSLGNASVGMPNVEMIALGNRSMKQGTLGGIDVGGEGMKHSVDAQHTHILSESGIICRDMFGVAEMYHA